MCIEMEGDDTEMIRCLDEARLVFVGGGVGGGGGGYFLVFSQVVRNH